MQDFFILPRLTGIEFRALMRDRSFIAVPRSREEVVKYILMLIFLLSGALCLYLFKEALATPVPSAVILDVRGPADADVFAADQVHPGTFKIVLAPKELFTRAAAGEHPERPLVTYKVRPSTNSIVFQYWLPRKDGTFYFAEVEQYAGLGVTFDIAKTEYANRKLTIYPKKSNGYVQGLLLFAALLFGLAVFIPKLLKVLREN